MVAINHGDIGNDDVDETSTHLVQAVDKYFQAYYAGEPSSPTQIHEVRQAFLSVIHWLDTYGEYDSQTLQDVLRRLLSQ